MQLSEHLEAQAREALSMLERFKKGLDEDPAYTLSWSEAVFAAAAKMRVAKEALKLLNGTENPSEILQRADLEVLQWMRDPNPSTSPCSNLMEQREAMAWFEVRVLVKDLGLIPVVASPVIFHVAGNVIEGDKVVTNFTPSRNRRGR